VEDRDLGQASRLAAATGAYVCFEDEAGRNLRPPKARTWAPRGSTPVVRVSGKGSGKVSVAGLACYQPGARSRFFYRARTHYGRKGERRSMSEADYASLVTAAHNQLHAPVILIWDNLNTHISAAMREGAWANVKNGLGNLAASDVGQLTAIVKNRLKSIQYRPALIEGFLAQTGLAFEPEPP
jgi:hypothetical protein